MRQPILLKTILDICFILLVLTFFSAVVIFLITLTRGDDFIPIEMNGNTLAELTPTVILLLFIELVSGALILYTVYILRKLVRDFFKGKLFTTFQIATLNLIGQFIILITFLQGLISFLGNILLESKVRVGINMDLSFGSFWFILAIGLFFIYLSKIFDNARKMKEENELTV